MASNLLVNYGVRLEGRKILLRLINVSQVSIRKLSMMKCLMQPVVL